MGDHPADDGAPVVVTMPAEVDVSNAARMYERLQEAVIAGEPLVIADFTATGFCDAAAVQRLLMVRDRATDRGATLRLVIPQGSIVRRVLTLLDVDHLLPVYASLAEARTVLITVAQHPFSP